MMPITTHTQIIPPTQVSLVATPVQSANALPVLASAVTPSVPDARIGPDHKGTGGYVSTSAQAPALSPASTPLSIPMPAMLSTSSASLSASSMFATQMLSQESGGAAEYLSEYEAIVAAAQVKYKPSNATMPEPPPNNLFAKMLAEVQNQNTARVTAQIQTAPKENAAQITQAAPQPKLAEAPKPKTNTQNSAPAVRYAASSYQATAVRNHAHLEVEPAIEPITG